MTTQTTTPPAREVSDVRDWLNVREAAQRSGLTVSGLRYLRSVGEGPPAYKIGKKLLIHPDDLTDWLTARTVAV